MPDKNPETPTPKEDPKALEPFSAPLHVSISLYSSPADREGIMIPESDLARANSKVQRLHQENNRLKNIIISYHLKGARANTSSVAYPLSPPQGRAEERAEEFPPVFYIPEAPQGFFSEGVTEIIDDVVSIHSFRSSRTGNSERTIIRYQQIDELSAVPLRHQDPVERSATGEQDYENESQVDSSDPSEGSTIRISEVYEEPVVTSSASNDGSSDTGSDIQIIEVKEDDDEEEESPKISPNELLAKATNSSGSSDAGSDIQITEVIEEEEFSRPWPNQENKNLCGPSSIYKIPDDFDPDQDHYGLSDVETVTSDEALSAWGIEEPLAPDQTKRPLANEEILYESDDEEGWEAVNKIGHPTPAPAAHLISIQAPSIPVPPDYTSWTINLGKGANRDTVEDDTLTILGDPFLDSATKSSNGDKKALTTAEKGRGGDSGERYQSFMSQVEEDILVNDMEKARKKSEDDEKNEREREYHISLHENDPRVIEVENAGFYQNPNNKHTLLHLPPIQSHLETVATVEEHKDTSHKEPQKDIHITFTEHGANKVTPITPYSSHGTIPDDPRLLDKFHEIWSTLTPRTLSGPINSISGQHSTIGWINKTPTPGDVKAQLSTPLQSNIQSKSKFISESERILLSFDPKEDVIGILRQKAKGEKNILDTSVSKVVPNISEKIKAIKPLNKAEDPIRKVGEIEKQFMVLKEKRLEQSVAQRKVGEIIQVSPDISSGNGPRETLLKNTQNFSTNRLILDIDSTDHSSVVTKQLKTPSTPTMTPKASHKVKSPSSSRKNRSPIINLSPLFKQTPSREALRDEEPELNHRKSLRFNDKPTPNMEKANPQTVKSIVNTGPPVVNYGQPKALVSILKPLVPVQATKMLPSNRTYNYEYIREVFIRNLPTDITYSRILDQVSGGVIDKIIIYWSSLEARVVFVEPEAARKFFQQVERTGFWVHTEIPQMGLAGNDSLVQCTLRGFQWTEHSSEMAPTIIQSIWRHRASRCLLLNNFPKSITVTKLTEDILNILADVSYGRKGIIETAVINHNLKVSSTGLLARVRFCAITLALKAAKELRTSSPDYADVGLMYDADPCGGLIGDKPPSCWIRSKEMMKDKPEGQKQGAKLPEPQKKLALPTQDTPIKRAQNRQTPYHKETAKLPTRGQLTRLHPTTRGPPVLVQTKQRKPVEAAARIPPPTKVVEPRATQSSVPPPRIFGRSYDNWGTDTGIVESRPEGAHWNHNGQDLVREYNDTIFNTINKRVRRNSDASVAEKLKAEKEKADGCFIDRLVYLTNLPRDFHAARLFRFIRGGMVEHVELRAPTSQYNTSSAIIVFAHRSSVKTYKNYLDSPGLTIEHNHRVVYAENVALELVKNIRLLNSNSIRNDGLTRCLRVDLLPKDTIIGEFIGIIEESMNHSKLVYEDAGIEVSKENKDTAVAVLKLMTIGTAIFVINVLQKNYDDINITFDSDPCQGPVEELDEVNYEMKA